jgi:hypothetical protein
MTREYTTAPASRLRHPATWIRTDDGGDAYLESLWQSYAARPLYPIICVRLAELLEVWDGNLRLEAALRFSPQGGDTELPVCIVTGEPVTSSLSLEIQMDSASHTKGLSDFEETTGGIEWLKLNPGATAKELARRIHQDETILSKKLSLARCIPDVWEAAKAGRIGYTKWHQISTLPPEEQPAALADCLAGVTRDEIRRRSRTRRNEANGNGQPVIRLPKLKIPLANETATGTVTVAGESLDLDDAETLLKEAMRAVRAAKDKNLDPKTAQAVWRDMAKGA